MNWHEVEMPEAVEFTSGRKTVKKATIPAPPDDDASVVQFEDGTAVACASNYAIYDSCNLCYPPKWWVYR